MTYARSLIVLFTIQVIGFWVGVPLLLGHYAPQAGFALLWFGFLGLISLCVLVWSMRLRDEKFKEYLYNFVPLMRRQVEIGLPVFVVAIILGSYGFDILAISLITTCGLIMGATLLYIILPPLWRYNGPQKKPEKT